MKRTGLQYNGIVSVAARYTRDMTVARGLSYAASVFLAAVILGGGYVGYRYYVAAAIEASTYREEKIPATRCVFQVSNFDVSYTGVAYFVGKRDRIDIEIYDSTGRHVQHMISDGYKNYTWKDSETTAEEVASDKLDFPNPRGVQFDKRCQPMWRVPPTIFDVPGVSV